MPDKMRPFARSTWPFDCGWATDAKSSRMPCVAQKRAKAPLAKFVPLSVMMLCGMPYRMVMSEMKVTAVGPFKTTRGGMTHLLVAVDKFTKWIEAKPIKKLNGPTAVTFIADITVRYDIPHNIITDNGTNFGKGALARFCATQGIRLDLASVAHPQSNVQVERANGLVLSGIKRQLVEPLERSAGC